MQQSLSRTRRLARLLGGGSLRLSDTLFRGFTLLLVLFVVVIIAGVTWVLISTLAGNFSPTKQFEMLVYFLRNRGIVVSRDNLLTHVWGYDYVGDTRTVDVHVRWLREKLEEDPANPKLIQTVRGVGYCFR